MNFVLALTGPAGSGKSTIAEKLAKQVDRCVNIDADHIKHMIVSGFFKDDKKAGGWSFSEWCLVGDSIGILVANFHKEGYRVVINGYIDEPAWTNIEKHLTITHKILLLPELDTVIKRDASRQEDVRMGEKAVVQHHQYFSMDRFFDDFIKIDTSNHSENDTVNSVWKLVEGAK